ncbi:ATP-binding protein [Archangium sp.]|jgi:signal transduction histidine kinase/CheY-like chemotaxis protein|uniref:ATP-binding protein n=1 Tax=Archangium sp. TaxID=1872627 RepID=UPI002ED820E8
MPDYASLSRTELARALESIESTPVAPDELKRLLRELQRHQLELELQNRQLREAQQELEESRARYVDLYDFAPVACMSLDARGCIRELNLTGAALLKRDRPHLLGQPFLPFVEPRDVPRFLQHVRQCFAGEPMITELALRVKEQRLVARLHGAPVLGGQPDEHLCRTALHDVTELRQMQYRLSLTERMATVGTLAAGVAHEINNPLAFLLGQLELAERQLRQWPASEPLESLRTTLGEARVGAERVSTIVRDLGTFSHPEARPMGPLDVLEVLDLSVKMAMGELRHRARLVRDYRKVPDVLADSSRLGQVFLNLLVNAAQAIPEGHADRHEIRLRVRAEAGSVVVEIHDTGQGIPAELLGRIFDPFFTTKPVGQGTGLGLSITHGLVTALGGELTVESEPGRGSVFRVRLPGAPVQTAKTPQPLPTPLEAPRRGRILIVDDEPMFAQTLKLLLGMDHDVEALLEAREALARLRNGASHDVILCDLMMAEMTGMQFHEELSRVAPELARRVIFMTGGAFTQSARDFLARVPNPWLLKPFKPGELNALLAPFLQ